MYIFSFDKEQGYFLYRQLFLGEYWIEKENFNMTCSADGKLSLVNCLFANQTTIGNFSCELYTDTHTFINHTKVVELNETESNLNHTLS